ncbi:MAG TPA: NAD(P)H-dependent oxidoreductase [Fimbriimonas sp.]
MTVLIQLFHPRLSESRVNRAWVEAARAAGYRVRDLYGLYADGAIEVAAEQEACESAEAIVFQHPMHWYGGPWLMKRWIDEVLKHGWAYGGRYALEGKRWLEAVAIGGREEEYAAGRFREYTAEEFLRPLERTAAFCRMQWEAPFLQFASGYLPPEDIEASAEAYVDRLRLLRIEDR